jgi:hypothetical protein
MHHFLGEYQVLEVTSSEQKNTPGYSEAKATLTGSVLYFRWFWFIICEA